MSRLSKALNPSLKIYPFKALGLVIYLLSIALSLPDHPSFDNT